MRASCALPLGIGSFLPCGFWCQSLQDERHIGWEKSGDGDISRPGETSSVHFLDEVLVLF